MFVKWLIVQTSHQTCFSSSCFSHNHHFAHFFAFASLLVPFQYCIDAFLLALQAIKVLDGKIVCNTFDDLHFSFFSNSIALLTLFDFSQKFIFVALLPKSQSHPQIQCCQCVIGCQCLSNLLCSFISNFIPL